MSSHTTSRFEVGVGDNSQRFRWPTHNLPQDNNQFVYWLKEIMRKTLQSCRDENFQFSPCDRVQVYVDGAPAANINPLPAGLYGNWKVKGELISFGKLKERFHAGDLDDTTVSWCQGSNETSYDGAKLAQVIATIERMCSSGMRRSPSQPVEFTSTDFEEVLAAAADAETGPAALVDSGIGRPLPAPHQVAKAAEATDLGHSTDREPQIPQLDGLTRDIQDLEAKVQAVSKKLPNSETLGKLKLCLKDLGKHVDSLNQLLPDEEPLAKFKETVEGKFSRLQNTGWLTVGIAAIILLLVLFVPYLEATQAQSRSSPMDDPAQKQLIVETLKEALEQYDAGLKADGRGDPQLAAYFGDAKTFRATWDQQAKSATDLSKKVAALDLAVKDLRTAVQALGKNDPPGLAKVREQVAALDQLPEAVDTLETTLAEVKSAADGLPKGVADQITGHAAFRKLASAEALGRLDAQVTDLRQAVQTLGASQAGAGDVPPVMLLLSNHRDMPGYGFDVLKDKLRQTLGSAVLLDNSREFGLMTASSNDSHTVLAVKDYAPSHLVEIRQKVSDLTPTPNGSTNPAQELNSAVEKMGFGDRSRPKRLIYLSGVGEPLTDDLSRLRENFAKLNVELWVVQVLKEQDPPLPELARLAGETGGAFLTVNAGLDGPLFQHRLEQTLHLALAVPVPLRPIAAP